MRAWPGRRRPARWRRARLETTPAAPAPGAARSAKQPARIVENPDLGASMDILRVKWGATRSLFISLRLHCRAFAETRSTSMGNSPTDGAARPNRNQRLAAGRGRFL